MAQTKYEGANALAYLIALIKGSFAQKGEIPTKVSDLNNDSGFVTTNTTYTIGLSEGTVTLTGSDGSTTTFDLPAGVTVDAALDAASENPVQNKAIYTALSEKQTAQQVSDAIDAAIATALANITGVSFEIVDTLPVTGEAGKFYLVPNSGSNPNIYDEYVWAGASGSETFEKIGTTDVDLSGYVQSSDLVELTNTEVQEIWDNVMNPTTGE